MEEIELKTLEEELVLLFENNDDLFIKAWLAELQPYDKAQLYLSLPPEYIRRYLHLLTGLEIAELLEELDIHDQSTLIQRVGDTKASEILNAMSSDDAADLLGQLTEERTEEILTSMDETEAEKIKALLIYPPDSAGGIMTNEFVWVKKNYTVGEATEKLRAFAHIAESIYYLYVINEERKLVGVLTIRDLLLHPPHTKVSDLMYERVISVPVVMDQEEVARIFERYNFVSVPVVDQEEHLLGIITHDDIVDVIIEEHDEDISRFSGASRESITLNTPAHIAAFRRLPWLIGLLLIGLITANIMSLFSTVIDQVVALTYFLPMIAGMTGNTGTQSLAVVIRGFSSKELNRKDIFRLIFREFGVALIIGSVCGLLIGIIATIWQDLIFGLVVGGSLLLTLIIGTLAGTLIPLLLNTLKVDPAVASGPLITTLNDIFSLFVYFGLASLFLIYLL